MTELPKGFTELSKDPRPITAIYAGGDPQPWFRIGKGCTKIEAFDESGQMVRVPWIAVFDGDEIVFKISAEHVGISYR